MLIYHPAYDAFHCVVRVCSILEKVSEIEVERLKILDFYLCFPSSIANLRLPKELLKLRRLSKSVENPYRHPLGAKQAFTDIEKILDPSLGCLTAAGLIEIDNSNHVRRTETVLPHELVLSCERFSKEESFFFRDCLDAFLTMRLQGIDGLKARSGLLEYRYDAA